MVTVGSSWTPPENYFDKDDGVYAVTCVRIGISDSNGIFIPGGKRTFEGGQFGPREVQDWTFALEDGQIIESMVSAPRINKAGEEVIGPKSQYYAYCSALFGGKNPPEGTNFDPQQHLIGRMGLATIQRNEQGYPRITNLGAMPTGPLPAVVVAPVAIVAPPVAVPVAAPVAAVVPDLPF